MEKGLPTLNLGVWMVMVEEGLGWVGWDLMSHMQGHIRSKKVENALLYHIS